MRIESLSVGFRITDEMPLTARELTGVVLEIEADYKIDVRDWPVMVDFDTQALWWETWLIRPVTDTQYELVIQHYNDY